MQIGGSTCSFLDTAIDVGALEDDRKRFFGIELLHSDSLSLDSVESCDSFTFLHRTSARFINAMFVKRSSTCDDRHT